MPRQPLNDLLALETAQGVAGPYCGKLLADYGATVIKIEPPGGDSSRRAGPFKGAPDPNGSGLFLHLNTAKRGIVIDLDTEPGRQVGEDLIARAALVIDDGSLSRTGLTYERLAEVNPRVVLTEITSFGPSGPHSDYRMNDFVAYAASGWMAAMGLPGQPPAYPGQDYPFYVAGLYAAYGSLTALFYARARGSGQRVGVSVLDATTSIGFYESTSYSYGTPLKVRSGTRTGSVAASVQPCSDGWVALTVGAPPAWRSFCEVIEAPELAEGIFATPLLRVEHADELEDRVRARLRSMKVDDVVRKSQERHIAVSPVLTTEGIFACEQLLARNWFRDVEQPAVGRVRQTGRPFRMTDVPEVDIRPAPTLGEHSEDVMAWLRTPE
jgi:CoA:oxalate CoA-transferase